MTVFERQTAARTLVCVGGGVKGLVYFNKYLKEHTPELRELLVTDSNTLQKLPLLQCFYFPVAILSLGKATIAVFTRLHKR